MRISVFLPTLNAGPELVHVLAAIRSQKTEHEVEIRAIDSGSTDGTQEVLKRFDVPFEVIDQADFGHGRTRNEGARRCTGELVAFLSQDARPAKDAWLDLLAAPFADARVAGAHARQLPRPGCHPFQLLNLDRHMDRSSTVEIREPLTTAEFEALTPEQRLDRIAFDNVASMVRREVLLALPFPDVPFGEDVAWARAALLAGHRLAFCPGATVLHSHDVTPDEFGRRVEEAHATLRRLTDFVPIPSRALQLRRTLGTAWRFKMAALSADAPLGRRLVYLAQAIPYAIRQMSAMYRGARRATYEPPT